jgi:hypothetical protein
VDAESHLQAPLFPMPAAFGPDNRWLYETERANIRGEWVDITLGLHPMKHSTLTLVVLAAVLVPWLAVVALGDWIRARRVRHSDALTEGR